MKWILRQKKDIGNLVQGKKERSKGKPGETERYK